MNSDLAYLDRFMIRHNDSMIRQSKKFNKIKVHKFHTFISAMMFLCRELQLPRGRVPPVSVHWVPSGPELLAHYSHGLHLLGLFLDGRQLGPRPCDPWRHNPPHSLIKVNE